jgi:hypothetical protein
MVMVAVPAAAALEAVRVRTLVLLVEAGLNDAVTPAGRPLALSATGPLKLLMPVTVTVLVPLAPWTTLTGKADRE